MERIKFDPKEMEVVGSYANMNNPTMAAPKFNTPITAKENLMALYNGQKPLWLANQRENRSFSPRVIIDPISRAFIFEAEPAGPGEAGGPDMFNIEWEYIAMVNGSMVRPGDPTVRDIEKWEDYITFPDIETWDWEKSAEMNKDYLKTDVPVSAIIMNGLFERLISFCDMENAMMALVDEDMQDGVHRLFDKLCILYDGMIEKFAKYFPDVDIINFHDDWGSQRAPFFSINTVREMISPYLKRVVDSAHKHGFKFDFHCCGKNELLVPAMIEAGVDTWFGQPMNDYGMLYDMYGDKIILGAAFNVPENATDEEMYDLASKFVEKYKKGNVRVSSMGVPQKAQEYLYELSRIALSE